MITSFFFCSKKDTKKTPDKKLTKLAILSGVQSMLLPISTDNPPMNKTHYNTFKLNVNRFIIVIEGVSRCQSALKYIHMRIGGNGQVSGEKNSYD